MTNQNGPYKLPGNPPKLIAIFLLVSLASVGAVMFTPGIPQISHFFQVDVSDIQWTVTLFILGYALGQLVYGPLGNAIGRRKSIFYGIWLALLSSLLCALSATLHSLTLLLIARFFAAIGAGVGLTIMLTVINDFYYPEQARKILPYASIAFAIMPGLAIFIGGLIIHYFAWQFTFYFLIFYYFLAYWIARGLPETLTQKDPSALKPKKLILSYWEQIKNFNLIGYSLFVGATSAFVYVYASTAPVIAFRYLGLHAAHFGTLTLIPSACLVIGNIITSRLTKYISAHRFILLAICLTLLINLSYVILVFNHYLSVGTFFAWIGLIYFTIPMIWTNCSVLATQGVSNRANANAILSFINISGATIGVTIESFFMANPARSMAVLYLIGSVFMLGLILLLSAKQR